MEVEFDDDDLAELEADPTLSAEQGPAVTSAFRRRLQFIRNAPDQRDFHAMNSLRFEKLKGKKQHQYSMRLNDQWRLIIELRNKGKKTKVAIIAIEDCH